MRQPTLEEQLSQAAREDASENLTQLDERWDRLAAGTLSEEEHDELRGLADASGAAHQAYQAFKPLGPAFQQNAVAAILARQRLEKGERATAAREAAPTPPSRPNARPGRELPVAVLAPARRQWALAGSFAATFVAVAAIFFMLQAQRLDQDFTLDVSPLSDWRGRSAQGAGEPSPGKKTVFQPGDRPRITVTTDDETGELEAKLFLLEPGGRLTESRALPKIENGGAAVLFVPLIGGDLPLPVGPSKLVVVLARPGKFPTSAEIAAAAAAPPAHGKYWQVLVRDVELTVPGKGP